MKRFPELKPNFWDVIVVLAVIALAALSAMTVWRGGTETGALTAVVTADGQEIDPGLCPYRDHLPQRAEHRVSSGPDRHSAHRRRGRQQRRGHCNRLGGEL